MKIKVLNTVDPFYSKAELEKLKKYCQIKTILNSRKEALKYARESKVILAGGRIKIDKELINNAKNLKLVLSPSTGTDHLDLDILRRKKIKVVHIARKFGLINKFTATSELSFCLLLSIIRKAVTSFNDAKKGIWSRDANVGFQLKDKTIGIIGLGRLGKISAKIANGFQMKVVAHDIKKIKLREVKNVTFNKLLKISDVIFVHVHLNKSTENLINLEAFKKMKKNTILINSSRGKIINEKDLLYALKNKLIAGAGLDVIDGEWLERKSLSQHPLIKYSKSYNNLMITAHIGGSTYESIKMARDYVFNYLLRSIQKKKI
jgi:phosphoglycerate dehydrogenase-like enzyme